MATKVDPFVYPLPKDLTKDKETRIFFEYLVRWAHDMWVRSGGGDDAVSEATIQEVYPWPTGQTFEDVNQFVYPQSALNVSEEWRAVTVISAHTASHKEFINASNGATITFPLYPEENAVFTVRNGDGSSIKLAGNGRSINGSTTGTLSRQETAIEFYYFIDTNEWFAR